MNEDAARFARVRGAGRAHFAADNPARPQNPTPEEQAYADWADAEGGEVR